MPAESHLQVAPLEAPPRAFKMERQRRSLQTHFKLETREGRHGGGGGGGGGGLKGTEIAHWSAISISMLNAYVVHLV